MIVDKCEVTIADIYAEIEFSNGYTFIVYLGRSQYYEKHRFTETLTHLYDLQGRIKCESRNTYYPKPFTLRKIWVEDIND
jgi:hypothetical protein